MTDASNAADPYEVVLADLRVQRAKIDQTITLLESLRVDAGAVNTTGPQESKPRAPEPSGGMGPGAFLGMTIVDAAKKLLAQERRAMGNAEILSAFQRGGLVLGSSDPLNVVSSVLTRRFGQVGDVVRVARGTWGLKEWYPNRSFATKAKLRTSGVDEGVFELPEADPEIVAAVETNMARSVGVDGDDLSDL